MTSDRPSAHARVQLRIAGVTLLLQGVVMEGFTFIALLVLLATGVDQAEMASRATVFALPYLQDNLYLMMAMSGIFAAIRVVGAVGLLRNRLWGLALSAIFCTVTLTVMVFLMPAGLVDGVISGAALTLMLMAWFGTRSISSR